MALTLAVLAPAFVAGQALTEERGRDRRGSDYTSFRARSLRDCKDTCRNDRRCRAYTYDTRDGSCYLKDRVNTAQHDSGMVTGIQQGDDDDYDGGYGGGYGRLTEERGYDRRGNDYTDFRARGLGECKDACRDDRRCRAYTFDTRNGSCYLKDRVNSSQRDSRMVTGYKGDGGGGGYGGYGRITEERGYDRRGNDYTEFRARGLGDCKDACRDDRRCQAYTYDTADRTCWLKSRVSSARRDSRMVTGVKQGDDGDDDDGYGGGYGRLVEEPGYDRRGNDYTSFRARGLNACKDACRDDRRCRAYTFDTRNGACFLKDRINSKRSDPGMVTGYKEE